MKAFKFLSILIVLLLVVAGMRSATTPSQAAAADREVAPAAEEIPTDQIILKYKADVATTDLEGPNAVDEIDRLSSAAGIELAYVRPMSSDTHVLGLPQAMTASEMAPMLANLNALPDVEYAEPDAIMRILDEPDDPAYADQWHYFVPGSDHYGVNAPAAWDVTTGSASLVVAVIDTGITTHPDLAGRTVPGYDFIADIDMANDGGARDADPSDPGDWLSAGEYCGDELITEFQGSSWHGTHVAGTIGALSDNGVGVAGINWNSKILPVRVLGKCGGYTSDIAAGMLWAAGIPVTGVPNNANPAKVLNLSLGGPGACSKPYQDAINDILKKNVTIVVSAGNSHANMNDPKTIYSPASCNGVITVGATDRYGAMAPYSNYGSTVEISAPGGDTRTYGDGVLSTLNDGTQGPGAASYVYYDGTSMSAPHVSGVASLLLSQNPNLSPAQVLQILQKTATTFPSVTPCETEVYNEIRPNTWCQCTTATCGSGIVNAFGAVSPMITSISPRSVLTGTNPLVLTVNGVNFNASSTVYFSGTVRTTHFVNSTQLTATLTLTDTKKAGAYAIEVKGTYGAAGTLTSAPKEFIVGKADVGPLYLPLIMKPKPLPKGPFMVTEDVDVVEGIPQAEPNNTALWVGHHWADCTEDTSDLGAARSLFKFNVSQIPTSTQISQAALNVYLIDGCYYVSQEGQARQVVTYRVTAPWAEASAVWANQPAATDAYGAANIVLTASSMEKYYALDVTGLVQGWINGSIPNQGLVLRGPEAGDVNGALFAFASSEAPASYVPYLTITYKGALSASEAPTTSTISIPVECKVTNDKMVCVAAGESPARK